MSLSATPSAGVSPIRVLLISTSYPLDADDWRGLFISQLVNALARNNCIDLRIWAPPGKLPDQVTPVWSADDEDWLRQLMLDGGISHLLRTRRLRALIRAASLLRRLARRYRQPNEYDVLHINWLQCALPLPNNGVPALLAVLGNDLELLNLPLVKLRLRRVMRRRAVKICPNAEWMEAPLNEAFGDVAEVQAVPFGIEPVWYGIKRQPCVDAQEWLAVTRLTRAKLGPLFDWSASLFAGHSRRLHLFGPMQEEMELPDWVHYHGSTTPEQLSQEWFPRANGLITLSQHAEGRPQVMLEAMAAGLPIIASNRPAHAQLIQHGVTGWLCDTKSEYAQAIEALEDLSVNESLGRAARSRVEQHIGTWDDCATRYIALYRELLAKHHA